MKQVFALLALICIAGCGMIGQTYRFKDVTKGSTVTLHKQAGQGGVVGMTVTGKGHIDGDAEIVILYLGKPNGTYKTQHLSGDVNFKWEGDWYSDTMEIQYKPSKVRGGNLRLQYDFQSL